jgi:hypothetical protein
VIPVGFVGVGRFGALVDGRGVDWHIPGKRVEAVLFDRFAPECMAQAANDEGSA